MAESFELPAHDRRVIETGRFTEEERSLLRRHLPAYRRLVEDASSSPPTSAVSTSSASFCVTPSRAHPTRSRSRSSWASTNG